MCQNNIETNAENYEIEDGLFRKKIKLKHDIISKKLAIKFPDIDITVRKIQKFLLIFQELIVLCNSDGEFSDSEIFLKYGKQIHNSLNRDIDSLKFPAVLKKNLKNFKSIIKLNYYVQKMH